jgi:hypothetical protein
MNAGDREVRGTMIEAIQQAVADMFGLSAEKLKQKKARGVVTVTRQVAVYWLGSSQTRLYRSRALLRRYAPYHRDARYCQDRGAAAHRFRGRPNLKQTSNELEPSVKVERQAPPKGTYTW